jgi:UDP-N-acetylglucosamine--N-acetylmuramyl-(pentapeptide) pyrophosphoryl-undecaprenol N-acetylglucosamine transferase
VTLWLSGRDVEGVSAQHWDGPVQTVTASGFPSGLSPRAVPAAFRLVGAFFRARSIMAKDRPDALLGMGSYASVGPALAARSLRVPIVLHEANALPGRAVAFLAGSAAAVALTHDATRQHLQHPCMVFTGFPVRDDLDTRFAASPLEGDRLTVLVMGGSQGADRLDTVASAALASLAREGRPVQVIHLSRPENADALREHYRASGVPALVFGFLAEIGSAYRAADLAVARAGAATCAELAACGPPAVLVPLPTARRNHQLHNARALAASGGVEVIEQAALDPERLQDYIEACLAGPEKLERMRQSLRSVARPDAAERIAQLLEDIAERQHAP